MVISLIERERAVHTGCCVCISSAGRQCPGAGSGLPSSTDGGGACQFVEPRARASCWALRHLRKRQMATRMMTRACAESSRQPHAADASIDVCTGPHDDGEDHGPGDAGLALLARVAAALLPSKHPVFGKVVEGMEIVKEIEGVPTDGRDKPIDAVRVETITIEE